MVNSRVKYRVGKFQIDRWIDRAATAYLPGEGGTLLQPEGNQGEAIPEGHLIQRGVTHHQLG